MRRRAFGRGCSLCARDGMESGVFSGASGRALPPHSNGLTHGAWTPCDVGRWPTACGRLSHPCPIRAIRAIRGGLFCGLCRSAWESQSLATETQRPLRSQREEKIAAWVSAPDASWSSPCNLRGLRAPWSSLSYLCESVSICGRPLRPCPIRARVDSSTDFTDGHRWEKRPSGEEDSPRRHGEHRGVTEKRRSLPGFQPQMPLGLLRASSVSSVSPR